LAAWLASVDKQCLTTREPGGTPAGDEIRHLLQHAPQGHGLVAEAELLLFAASRAQLVRELILPALAEGKVVVSDRFHDSTTVYQGVARRLETPVVTSINNFAIDGCRPDITFLLDMDAGEAHARLQRRERPADRMEREPLAFYQAVRAGYLELAASEPARFAVLDATLPEEELAASVRTILEEKFHGFFAR
jgi:dTMP kinase